MTLEYVHPGDSLKVAQDRQHGQRTWENMESSTTIFHNTANTHTHTKQEKTTPSFINS